MTSNNQRDQSNSRDQSKRRESPRKKRERRQRVWARRRLSWEAERVLLAWLRTSISLFAVGFLLSRFDLLSKEGNHLLVGILGMGLVGLGGVIAAAATCNFFLINTRIQSKKLPGPISSAPVLTVGIFLAIFSVALILISLFGRWQLQ